MPLKCSVYIATSLDGFIAREDGTLDWLDAAQATVTEGEDCGYAAFRKSVDVIVMGRNTYETVLGFAALTAESDSAEDTEKWFYKDTPMVVVTSKPDALCIPPCLSGCVSASSLPPSALHSKLEGEGYTHAYIDGGRTVQGFMRAGLVETLIITLIPIILGKGIPLLKDVPETGLTLVESKSYPFGFVQNTYTCKKKESA
ncbi:hypothetical protein KIPB_007876 [Kipferlia bialata]|uniref:Bacterial bifunctional deaminase-reductase C-terminal domain-containing protein n=1 Tax=Kipferlia bialata TaxID=797122 RepID=A0A9K3D0Z5_9EUKA|nr:hypothetical protein KIPB_007876 [Kipferlia bialata]|eukprot:g7876.t1